MTEAWTWFSFLSLAEPDSTGVMLLVLGVLVAISAVFSRVVDRLGVPVMLLFLGVGMLAGGEGILGYPFENYGLAVRLGNVALVLILFDGGFNTSAAAIRQVLYPSVVLATAGVAATAALVAVFARFLGLSWSEATLLGAVVSSTDAAAVFAVLRGGSLHLQPKVGHTVEVESCLNDPMAIILTLTIIEAITSQKLPGWSAALSVVVQLVVGAGVGVIIGGLARKLLPTVSLGTVGLYPVLTLSVAFISFGAATLAYGSGVMAVFITGVILGNSPLPYKNGLARVHDAMAWLSQVGMFLMMGLLVFPSRLMQVAGIGLAVGLFLALVARPLSVIPLLLPFGYSIKQVAYIGWVGLRGSVPIILGTFPVLAGVPGAERVFDTVFFIVVVSSVIPGSTLRWVTRLAKLNIPERPAPQTALEINSPHPLEGELVAFLISPAVAVCGASLRQIELPSKASVVLVIRGSHVLAARGDTVLQEGDHAYVYFRYEDRPFVELLFGRPQSV